MSTEEKAAIMTNFQDRFKTAMAAYETGSVDAPAAAPTGAGARLSSSANNTALSKGKAAVEPPTEPEPVLPSDRYVRAWHAPSGAVTSAMCKQFNCDRA